MKISFWNVRWKQQYNIKSKIAENLLTHEGSDFFGFSEVNDKRVPEIEGYNWFHENRKNITSYADNDRGILVYAKQSQNVEICMEVQEELRKNELSCFLPLKMATDNDRCLNCLYVWTIQKKTEQSDYMIPYGYNRFNEMLNQSAETQTYNFLDGFKNNVVIIGDFNMVYSKHDVNSRLSTFKERGNRWDKLCEKMHNKGLYWIGNTEPTFLRKNKKNKTSYYSTIDHCFMSINFKDANEFKLGEFEYVM